MCCYRIRVAVGRRPSEELGIVISCMGDSLIKHTAAACARLGCRFWRRSDGIKNKAKNKNTRKHARQVMWFSQRGAPDSTEMRCR